MKPLPSVSAELNNELVKKIIIKNFNSIIPHMLKLTSEWLNGSYGVFKDINKYLILIYFVNKDFEFYRRNNINITYENFYKNKDLEIIKSKIIQISKDLNLPKESVRRKLVSLEKQGIISKTDKKIKINRSAYKSSQPKVNLNNVSNLLSTFSKILKKEKVIFNSYSSKEVSLLIKQNFTFCWYQFYKFLIPFTYRWQSYMKDLEKVIIINTIVLNSTAKHIKRLKGAESYLEGWRKEVQKTNIVGINAMSISDITGIPRPTVVRKLNFLVKNKYLSIDKKKLYHIKLSKQKFKEMTKIQDQTILSLSDFITRTFNQININ